MQGVQSYNGCMADAKPSREVLSSVITGSGHGDGAVIEVDEKGIYLLEERGGLEWGAISWEELFEIGKRYEKHPQE